MTDRHFLAALAASITLHALVLAEWPVAKVSPRDTALNVRLLPAPPPGPAAPMDSLLKNTFEEAREPAATKQPEPRKNAVADTLPRHKLKPPAPTPNVARKLSEVLFYPPEAVARRLEGEVRLLLTLGEDGTILDAQVAAGSGHALLDEAAVKAAFAMGRLPNERQREVLFPVVFRLR